MKDLDDPRVCPQDFPLGLRYRMVAAYPIIADMFDAYAATEEQINEGFQRILDSTNLRPVAVLQRERILGGKSVT